MKPFTIERRLRITVAKLGHQVTQATRDKISAAKRGRVMGPLSAEHRQSISEAKTGKPKTQPPHTESTRLWLTVAHLGKTVSDEQRAKMSASRKGVPNLKLKGKPLSDEHREKLRAAWTIRRSRLATPEKPQ